jgi:hypothetical protein
VALSQVLWSLDSKQLLTEAAPVNEQELEDALHTNIGLLDPNWLVIGRQVKTSNGKFLDLLCMDRDEDLVVVELKKDVTPREVTAQVIEYASYMTEQKSEDLGKIYADYSAKYLGVRTFSWTDYAINPRLRLYSSGLIPPRDNLMRFSLYHLT